MSLNFRINKTVKGWNNCTLKALENVIQVDEQGKGSRGLIALVILSIFGRDVTRIYQQDDVRNAKQGRKQNRRFQTDSGLTNKLIR